MRKYKRFIRNLTKKFFIYVVVFVSVVNACFFVPMKVQAADSVSYVTPYMRIFFDNDVVVDHGKPVSPYPDSSFQVVKTSSSFRQSRFSGSSATNSSGTTYFSGSTSFSEIATFEGSFRVGIYFWNEGELADLFSNGYINLSTLNVYIPFRLTSASGTDESGGASIDDSNHLYDGIFDIPTVITLPNGGEVLTNLMKSSTSVYVLELTLVDISYRSGSSFYVDCPYICSSESDSGTVFYENLDISVEPLFSVYDDPGAINDGYIRYTTGVAYSGESVDDIIGDNVQDLVDGYNDSAGNQAASDLGNSASGYEQAEDSLFQGSESSLSGFEFFDFSGYTGITTGLSFVSSMLVSIYNNFGGMSGIGIVISVLFSVMFLAIVIGLYRYFK